MSEIPGVVERRHRVAAAIYEKNHHSEWPGGLSFLERGVFYRCADAAIAAHEAALSDAGMVIVPREPTEAMVHAPFDAELDIYWGYSADGRPGGPEDAWRAMVDAALKEA